MSEMYTYYLKVTNWIYMNKTKRELYNNTKVNLDIPLPYCTIRISLSIWFNVLAAKLQMNEDITSLCLYLSQIYLLYLNNIPMLLLCIELNESFVLLILNLLDTLNGLNWHRLVWSKLSQNCPVFIPHLVQHLHQFAIINIGACPPSLISCWLFNVLAIININPLLLRAQIELK